MKPYSKYKKSGVEWIEDIPKHWEVKKLKYWVSLVNEKASDEDSEFKLALENIQSETGKLVNLDSEKTFEGEAKAFKPNDVLFNKLRPYLSKVYFAEKHGCCVGELLILRGKDFINSKFLFYRVIEKTFINEVDSSTYGSKMPRANWEDFISQLEMPVPPIEEQTQIAHYLDKKTATIDTLIAHKQDLIGLLHEEKAALIQKAVTKGIDTEGVIFKASGVEWLGEIPEHWEVKKLKYISEIKYGLGQPPRQRDDGLPLIRATNVFRGEISEKDMIYVDPDDIPYERDPVLKENDIIVVLSGAYTADSAIIPKKYEGAITGYDMVVRVNKAIPKFIAYCLLTNYVLVNQLYLHRLRAAQPHLNREELGETFILLPSIEEQSAIVHHIEAQNLKINNTISQIEQEVVLLKEYRVALISEAVTGKIDVRTA